MSILKIINYLVKLLIFIVIEKNIHLKKIQFRRWETGAWKPIL